MRRLWFGIPMLLGLVRPSAAQVRPVSVRLDSVVAPSAQFAIIAQVVAFDSVRAVVLDGKTYDVSLIVAGVPAPAMLSHKGEGPGEFRIAGRIGRLGDSTWVITLGASQGKFALLARDGRGGRTVDAGVRAVPLLSGQTASARAILGNGSALVIRRYGPDLQSDSTKRQSAILVGSAASAAWAEVATLDAIGPFNVVMVNPNAGDAGALRSESYFNPFRVGDEIVARPNGIGFAVIRQRPGAPGAATRVTVEVYDVTGKRTASTVVNLPAVPDGDKISIAMRDQLQHRLEQSRFHPTPADASAAILTQVGRKILVPATTLAFVSGDNTLWLQRIGLEDQPRHWARVDLRTGRVADITFSVGCAPADEIQGRLWLSCVENDVPVVRRGWLK